jgi:hypothetical protein
MNNEKSNWADMASGLGICLILLGMGGCGYLWNKDSNSPIIVIKQEVVQEVKQN